MAIYHYDNNQIIDRVEVHTPRHGLMHATLVMGPGVSVDALQEIRKKLGANLINSLMDTVDGRPAIQIRGVKNEKSLFENLAKIGLTTGTATKEATPDDHRTVTAKDKLRDSSLFLSAVFYDLGNAAFFASGIQRGKHNKDGNMTANDKSEMAIGAAFSLGDVLMTAYGKENGSEELRAVQDGLKEHFKEQGVEIPKGDSLNPDTLHASGAMAQTDQWLRKHIIHLKCASEFLGGLLTIHSGMKKNHLGEQNTAKMAAGAMIATGWLSTMLMEKPRGHNIFDGQPNDKPTAMEAIGNNPRGYIARPLAILNNVSNLWGAAGNPEKSERVRFHEEVTDAQAGFKLNPSADNKSHLDYTVAKQHDYGWNVGSACSFLIAHVLFGISGSKRPQETEYDKCVMNDMVLMSANMLASQPDATRQQLVGEAAEYVAGLTHVTLGKDELAKAINEKIDSLNANKWTGHVQNTQNAAQLAMQ